MALSNIGREPRREITESLLGTILVFGLIFVDWKFGHWVQAVASVGAPPGSWDGFWIVGMLIGAIGIVLIYPLLFLFPHFIGEIFCDALKGMGIDPRPKQRY